MRPSLIGCLFYASLATLALGCARSNSPITEAPSRVPTASQEQLNEITVLNKRTAELYQAGKYAEALPLKQRAAELSEKALGPEHPAVATGLNNLAALYYSTGQYAKAEPLYQRALAIAEKALGPEHPTVAASLNSLAGLYAVTEQYAKAGPLYQRALTIREKALGPEHPDVANTLNNLATLYYSTGQYAKAEPLYQRALAIAEKALGPDHPTVTIMLNTLAAVYQHTGAHAKAEPLYQRALVIAEKALGPDHPDVAAMLNNLAEVYRATGAYAKAEPLYHRALAINEQALGPEHPAVANSLNNLANLYQQAGSYAKAEPLYHRALVITEKALGPSHSDVAIRLNNLAALYLANGSYAKAQPLSQRSVLIAEKALGPAHPDVAAMLNNLAEVYRATGAYAKAEPLYHRALAINEQALGPEHPAVANSLNNLALLYRATGSYVKAEPLYHRALAINEQALGPEHPAVANSLTNLAALYDTTGQYAKAEPLYHRALAINEQALGPEHPAVAQSLHGLATLYLANGSYAKAEPLYHRALTIREKALGPEHPNVAATLNNLALLYHEMRAYTKSEPLSQRSLAIHEKALGPEHPDVGLILSNQAGMSARGGRHQQAADLFVRIFGIEERQIQNVFTFTSEADKLQFVQFVAGNLNGYLSLVHQHLGADRLAVRAALGVLLRRKGVVFEAQSRLQETRQGQLSGDARQDWERLSALRGEYARLTLHKPENMTSEQYRETLASLQRDMEAVEQRLARESGLVAQELAQRKVTVEQVAEQLPTDAALVEFVKIRDIDFMKSQRKSSSRYLAFVLTAAGNVTLVDLGEADAVDRQANRTLENIKVALMTRRKDHLLTSHESLAQLSALVWKPLASVIGNVNQLIVSPDGQLNLVPFAALVEGTGQPLLERFHVAYVSSGRELITSVAAFTPETELLLVANPAYDQLVPAASSPGSALRSRDFRGHFDPLPGTEREAHEIPPLIAGSPAQKRVILGPNATERVVKAARSPRVLHLATHGFFLQDKLISLETSLRGVQLTMGSPQMGAPLPAGPMDLVLPQRYENPLVRSGLALAGANHAGEITDGEDGILTALEITGMDLHGTDLVVLSACDTALGTVQNGEGVFGLRRAFSLAGAKNLLMSLWAVDDEVTADQMKAFYQNLRMLPPAEALRQTQLATIRRLKAHDGVANPGLWAPFILQGAYAFGP